MVAPSAKTPRITNADKSSIVLDPGTLVFNDDTNVPEYVNLAGSFVQLTPGGVVANVIHQQLWVNFTNGLDTNDGGLYTPFKTYAAATTHAALTASPTNRFLINLIGDFTEASPVLHPFMDLAFSAGTFTVTGGMALANSWDTVVNNELVTITGMKMAGFWSFSWIANNGNIVRFLNCDHGLTTSGIFLSNPGSLNALQIINDTSLVTTSYSSSLFLTQSPSVLFNATVGGTVWYDLLSDGLTIDHYLLNSSIPFGIVVKKSIPNTSTQVVHVRNTPMPVNSPVLEDPLSTVEIDTVSYLNDPTILLSGDYDQIITKGLNGIRQQLWVNAAVGNDLNNGGLNQPFKTYDAARTFAASKVSPTNRYLIKVVGNQTAVGDILINPYIDLDFEDCVFTSGDSSLGIGLDASWASIANEKVYISGFRPVSTIGLNILFNAVTNTADWLIFINSNFEQCPVGSVFSSGGTGSVGNDNGIAFIGDANPLGNNFSSGLSIGQVKTRLENMSFGAAVGYQLLEDDYFIHHYLFNCSMTDLSNVRFSGNGSQYLHIRNCNVTNPITLDCQLGTITIDTNSYSNPITLGGLNTYADVTIYDSTDGMILNTYSPSNWAFVPGNYAANALTGHLAGIDSKLGAFSTAIGAMSIVGLSGAGSFAFIGSQEMRVNNLCTATFKMSVSSASNTITLTLHKSMGGNFTDIKQAVGSGTCSVTPTPVLNDAQVQDIQAVVADNKVQVVIKVNNPAQDYILELQFMYEVT